VILGDEGSDLVQGGSRRDLLAGGVGADRLVGDADDDIMIADQLNFANQETAIWYVMAEWTSSRAYLARIANLQGTGTGTDFANRSNGNYFLNAGISVIIDTGADVLTGSSGQDWFLFDTSRDRATDLKDEAFTADLAFILS
jgi:Ca2+-binding RTX toxin-like protein